MKQTFCSLKDTKPTFELEPKGWPCIGLSRFLQLKILLPLSHFPTRINPMPGYRVSFIQQDTNTTKCVGYNYMINLP